MKVRHLFWKGQNNQDFIEQNFLKRRREITNTFIGGAESMPFLLGKCAFPCGSCVEYGTWTYLWRSFIKLSQMQK